MIIFRPIAKLLSILLAISYCYFGYVNVIGDFSIGVIAFFLLTLIFLSLQITQNRMPIPKILILLTAICTFFLWLDLAINMDFRQNALKQYITPIGIFFSTMGIIYYLNFTKFYLFTFIVLILFSCSIALFQGMDFDLAWDLRYALPVSSDIAVENQLKLKEKPVGLSLYAVQLGYQIVFVGCLLLILSSLYSSASINRLVAVSYIFLLVVAAFGKNLSSLLSLLVMILIFFNSQGGFKYKFKLKYILIAIFLIIVMVFSPIWERIIAPDASMLSRIVFVIVGLILIINNPFGVKRAELYDSKLEIVNELFGTGSFAMLENILETSFHNSFLNIGVQIGWIGLILYIFLYLNMMYYYFLLSRNRLNQLSLIGSIGFAFLFGYGIQCITHNAGPLTKDPYFWIANGFLIGSVLTIKSNKHLIKKL